MKTIKFEENLGLYEIRANQLRIPIVFKKNGDILKATNGTNCREVAANRLASLLSGKDYKLPSKTKAARLMRKARILFLNTKSPKSRVEACIKVLNMFENKTGLDKTTVVNVKIENKPSYKNYMFVGDSNWYKSPVTISLYLLILRYFLVSGNVNKFKKIKSLENFYEFIETDSKFTIVKDIQFKHILYDKNEADLHTIYHTYKHWEKLMSNIGKLLPKINHGKIDLLENIYQIILE